MKKSRELSWRIKPLGSEIVPAFVDEDPTVKFVVPEHVQGLALGVIVRAAGLTTGEVPAGVG